MVEKELYEGLIENYQEVLKDVKKQLELATGSDKLRLKYQLNYIEEMINVLTQENKR